ncbi:hypothetical protein CHU98_g295 [Xylaria longipes]|nr:hypothetical protein CHU98_g295 [Xylaria longipes]
MYTMFRRSINNITARIRYDVMSTREQLIISTSVLVVRCRVKPEALCKRDEFDLEREPTYRMLYIRHFKPALNATLTAHGNEAVLANKEKATYNIERLKEAIRLTGRQVQMYLNPIRHLDPVYDDEYSEMMKGKIVITMAGGVDAANPCSHC